MTPSPLIFSAALLCLAAGLSAAPVSAAAVFTENADSYSAGEAGRPAELPVAKGAQGVNWWSFSKGGGRTVTVERDAQNRFSKGEQNKVITFSRGTEAASQHNLVSNHFEPLAAGQIAFDFFAEPEGAPAPGVRLLLMGTNVDYAQNLADYKNDAAVTGVFIQNAAIRPKTLAGSPGAEAVAFEPGRAHSLVLVFNNTSASMAYADGTQTLAAGDMDVWLDGEKKATWPLNTASAVTASKALQPEQADAQAGVKGLWFNAAVPVSLQLDNIRVTRAVDAGTP